MVGSLIEARLFGSMKEDEECDYDHILFNDFSLLGGDKENRKRQLKYVKGYSHRDGIHAVIS